MDFEFVKQHKNDLATYKRVGEQGRGTPTLFVDQRLFADGKLPAILSVSGAGMQAPAPKPEPVPTAAPVAGDANAPTPEPVAPEKGNPKGGKK